MAHPLSRLSLFGLPSFVCYGYLSQFEANEASLLQAGIALGAAALLQACAWYNCWRYDFYPSISELLFWAVAFRLLGIFGNPVLEDDFYRYLWDGYMLMEHGIVYSLAPQHWFDAAVIAPPFEDILDNINNPHIATIYGPVCQFVFGLGFALAPGEVWPLQLIFSVFDIGIICLLCTLTNTRNVLLYAWCPLVIKEIAFTAHIDSMAVFFLLAACVAMIKNRKLILGVMLALAIASKVFAIILLPLLLYRRVLSTLIFSATLILLYAPFIPELAESKHGLAAMASGWVFNAPLFLLLPQYFVQLQILMLSFFACIWCFSVWHWRKKGDELPRIDWIYAGFLLVIPALNPWYLIWVLPFAALKPSLTAWTASVAVLFAYVIGLNIQSDDLLAYQQPLWALCLEYGLVFAAFAFDLTKQRQLKFK